MTVTQIFVSCPVQDAVAMVESYVVSGSISGEMVDQHAIDLGNGRACVVQVFEKYYWRAGNRLTLTVTIDDATGRTRVHAVGGGGSESVFFRFDWGASKDFSNAPAIALDRFIID